MPQDESFFRGYTRGYEEGLEEAWDDLIGLTTKGYTSREIQVLAKTKRSEISRKVALKKRRISEETGISLLEVSEVKKLASGIEPGSTYILEDKNLNRTIPIFNEAVRSGVRGMCIVRTHPSHIKTRFLGEPEFTWLTKTDANIEAATPGVKYVSPGDLGMLSTTIQKFLKISPNGVIILEGLEYLVRHNDFNMVFKWIQSLKDQVLLSKSVLLLPLNSSALDPKDIKALQCEIEQEI